MGRLEKFCFCLDVPTGVRYTGMAFVGIWIIYFLGALLGGGSVGNWVWGLILSIGNIVCFLAVVYGMRKNVKMYLLPALFLCLFDIVVAIINGIINFIILNWFSAIWILFIGAL